MNQGIQFIMLANQQGREDKEVLLSTLGTLFDSTIFECDVNKVLMWENTYLPTGSAADLMYPFSNTLVIMITTIGCKRKL